MPTMRTLIRIPWFVTMATSVVALLGARPGRLGLEIVGNANAFDQTNQNFVPPPPAEFFTGGR